MKTPEPGDHVTITIAEGPFAGITAIVADPPHYEGDLNHHYFRVRVPQDLTKSLPSITRPFEGGQEEDPAIRVWPKGSLRLQPKCPKCEKNTFDPRSNDYICLDCRFGTF